MKYKEIIGLSLFAPFVLSGCVNVSTDIVISDDGLADFSQTMTMEPREFMSDFMMMGLNDDDIPEQTNKEDLENFFSEEDCRTVVSEVGNRNADMPDNGIAMERASHVEDVFDMDYSYHIDEEQEIVSCEIFVSNVSVDDIEFLMNQHILEDEEPSYSFNHDTDENTFMFSLEASDDISGDELEFAPYEADITITFPGSIISHEGGVLYDGNDNVVDALSGNEYTIVFDFEDMVNGFSVVAHDSDSHNYGQWITIGVIVLVLAFAIFIAAGMIRTQQINAYNKRNPIFVCEKKAIDSL